MKTMNRGDRVAVCSPYRVAFGLIRESSLEDSSWEQFGVDSLPTYFTDGIEALRAHLLRLEDPTKLYSVADENRLWFMVESLIQARRVIEDNRSERSAVKEVQ